MKINNTLTEFSKTLKDLKIIDLSHEYIDDSIALIKEEYGNDYYNPIFYDKEVIRHYVKKIENKENIFWKCAYYQGKLVGQTFLESSHGIGCLKLTIISERYRHQGILSKLFTSVIKDLKYLKSNDFQYVYAFISNKNTHLLNLIHKYQYKKLGETPSWKPHDYFIILGRDSMIKKDQWKMITIYMKLYGEIFQTIKDIKIKRFIQARSKVPSIVHIQSDEQAFKSEKIIDVISNKIIFYRKTENDEKEVIAEIYETVANKSWFDFHFKKEINHALKYEILKSLVNKFNNAQDINSLTISIDVNDYIIQKYSLDLNLKYYAYMPFYYETDKILMGKSKIISKEDAIDK